jgi:hypothetical protein
MDRENGIPIKYECEGSVSHPKTLIGVANV